MVGMKVSVLECEFENVGRAKRAFRYYSEAAPCTSAGQTWAGAGGGRKCCGDAEQRACRPACRHADDLDENFTVDGPGSIAWRLRLRKRDRFAVLDS